MDAFSYLSVLLSIIVGLAITQVLQGYRGLLLSRSRVTLYAPPLLWSVLMLVIATQNWWSSFGLEDHHDWNFATFLVILTQTVLLYMMAGLCLPDIPPGEPVDLRAHYYREIRPFFGLFLAMLAVSIVKEVLLEGRLPEPGNLSFHGVFAIVGILGMTVRRPRYHEVQAIVVMLLIAAYIAMLFARL